MEKSLTYYVEGGKYIYYSYYCTDGRAKKSTKIKTPTGFIEDITKQDRNKLNTYVKEVDIFVAKKDLAQEPVTKADIVNLMTELIDGVVSSPKLTVHQLVERFIDGARKGDILNKRGERYSEKTLTHSDQITTYLHDKAAFFGNKDVNKITADDFHKFQAYMTRDGKSKNTIGIFNNKIATMITKTKGKWHNVDVNQLNVYCKMEDADYPIFYTKEELKKLYEFEMSSKSLTRTRDVFVFGSFICLRHGDYYETNYRDAFDRKNNTLVLKTGKNKSKIYIPLHPVAVKILEKYNFEIPKFEINYMNKRLKDMAKEAGFVEKVHFSRTLGGVTHNEYVEKYKLTSTHTMRRNFVTNAILDRVPELFIQQVGGWKSDKSYRRYIRLGSEQMAELSKQTKFYDNW